MFGRCVVELTLNGIRYPNVTMGVMKNLCSDVLLGRDFQRQHERVVFVYDGTKPELEVSSQRKEACAVAAATVECPPLFNCLTSDWRPVCLTSRRYSAADTAYIESEVKKLFAEGIIRESKSPWRAQPLVVTNRDTGKKRLCVDYSQTVNLFTILDAYPLPKIEGIINKLAKYKVFCTLTSKAHIISWSCNKLIKHSLLSKQQVVCGSITGCPLASRMVSRPSSEPWTQLSTRRN